MIAVDTNVLVYAHIEEHALHQKARERIVALAEGNERWSIPVFCLGEFLRLTTHPRLFRNPYSPPEACAAISRLLESPSIYIIQPGDRFVALLLETVEEAAAKGNLVFDAMIAALCREVGVSVLLTEDRDFDRFKKIRTERL